MPPRGLDPTGVILVDKPAGPSSFAVVAEVRRRTGARTGHAGTLDPVRDRAARAVSPVGRLSWHQCFVGSTSATLTERRPSRRGRRPATPRARSSTSTSRRRGPTSRTRSSGLRGEVELPIPAASAVKIGGERAYRLHRRGVAVEMPRAALADRRARRHRVRRTESSTLDLRVSSGTYVRVDRRRARRPLRARCAAPRSARSGSRRPIPDRSHSRSKPALARIGVEAAS